jgi:hypothetical protein
MSAQMFTILTVMFVLGLFVGTNLGIVLMCLLQFAGGQPQVNDELAPVAIES